MTSLKHASTCQTLTHQHLQPFWPTAALKEEDLYFYLEAIEEYLPGNRVRVAGHGEMLLLGATRTWVSTATLN